MRKGNILDYTLILAFTTLISIFVLQSLGHGLRKITDTIDQKMCHINDTCIVIAETPKGNKHAR